MARLAPAQAGSARRGHHAGMAPLFADRTEAAHALAARLVAADLARPVVVLALPRGGVPIGAVVAQRLHAPLDLLLVRKIGAPGQPELAVAAVVDGAAPETVVDAALAEATGADDAHIRHGVAGALRELERRRRVYLAGRPAVPLQGATAIVVDDGIATGTTVRAALKAVRRRGAAHVVLAVPVAPHDTLAALAADVDAVVCLAEPSPFRAVGDHYADFRQLGDDDVLAALEAAPSP